MVLRRNVDVRSDFAERKKEAPAGRGCDEGLLL